MSSYLSSYPKFLDTQLPRLKRIADITLVFISIPFVIPILGAILLLVSMDSPGKPLFEQDRVGKYGKRFKAWKVRTMVEHADQLLEEYFKEHPELLPDWELTRKLKDDPRITRIGRFLRHSSLDELPQLWNVLKGEMSLVGPRPILPEEIEEYGQPFELYMKAVPGLTGLWQVCGRNNLDFKQRILLDEEYIKNWSIGLDISILLRTIWVVVTGNGAY